MENNKLNIFLLAMLVISFGTAGYFGYYNYLLQEDKRGLGNQLSQTKADFVSAKNDLEAIIASLEQKLAEAEAARDDFERKYNEEKSKIDYIYSQVKGIEGQVGALEKLSRTDPELLKKYSKVYFLNENYVPRELVKIDPQYTFNTLEDYFMYKEIERFFLNMMLAAEADNIHLRVISAYRSFGTQSELKSAYKMIYGSGANSFSADQGYSEHQLGTTLDFTTLEIGAGYLTFDETPAYQWLINNAYKYGFILSYPEDNQYYRFEPWHWRFVSRDLANDLHLEGKNFYDMDQREIDLYLISFFD